MSSPAVERTHAAHASGHDHDPHDPHDPHAIHPPPTSFYRKYVYSTDHKVIAVQFTVAALFFVFIGGGLALAVRYQLAWPNQHVPFHALLPNKMTQVAPEANVAFWEEGKKVIFNADTTVDGTTYPKGTVGTLTRFPVGLAVTLPAGTVVADSDSGTNRTLETPLNAFVQPSQVMGDYNYARQDARVESGTLVSVPPTGAPATTGASGASGASGGGTSGGGGQPQTLKVMASTNYEPTGPERSQSMSVIDNGPILLPTRPADTLVSLDVPAQTVVNDDTKATVSVHAGTVASVSADKVTYNKDALTTDAYIQLFTMHASIMVFFVLMPMLLGGFGNYLIPLMIGARDMAFPRLNALSFWLSVPAGLIMVLSFWTAAGPAGGGWTMYPTLSEYQFSPQLGTTLWLVAVGLVGFSTIVGTLNYITTTINMRAPGMTMFRMPLTVWSLFITAILALLATPVLTAAAIMLILDRTLGTMFFNPARGGQPLMWQHLFWFFGHPEVYILILPPMGIVSDVIASYARKPIFGYKPMVFAMTAISGLGFIVWGHHMFQSGMNPVLGTTFMASTIMIAVPSAIKTFNWLGTLWGGNIRFTPAMLNALGFVSMFVVGGLSGIFMAAAPVDIHFHDTYFIVAHIHYVFFGGTMFGVFAGVYHWFPKVFGRQLNQKWGRIHFIMTFIAFNGTFFAMHILGLGGHPRRYATIEEYPTLRHLQPLNVFMSICALMLGAAQLPFIYNILVSAPRKLGRAVTSIIIILLGGPAVIGLSYWNGGPVFGGSQMWLSYDDKLDALMKSLGTGAAADAAQRAAVWTAWTSTMGWALLAGAIFAIATVVIVRLIWWVGSWPVGGHSWGTAVLQRLLYVVFLPAFLSPVFMKHDSYMWARQYLGLPDLYQYWWVLLALTAVPGLIYLAVFRPKDEFGYAAGDNPWHANSLEWCTSSPPPFHNFDVVPTVYRGPYEYSSPAVREDYLTQPHVLPPGVVEPSGH